MKKTIEDLGFKEERDYDGKIVLKNNIPIKKKMPADEVEALIKKLNRTKYKMESNLHSKSNLSS